MAAKTLTIEIGTEFIKICEMQSNKKTVMVHHAISVQTPPDSVEDGFIRDINRVSETIRNAMTQDQIVASEVTFVLNSSKVVTKEVILPLLKKEKVQGYITSNASEYFPVNIDDYVLSYTVLETKNTKDEKKSRVLVYAALEAMVDTYYNLARVLGMRVKAVDYAGNSTLQLIKIQIDARPTMVVQLGMDTTIVSIMKNNILQLQRTIPYGESLLLNAIIDSKNVSSRVAMELIGSAKMVKETLDKDEITGSLKYLISNVNRVIEYYSGRNTESPLQKVVIIGDGADILGIDELFSNETNLPAERVTLLKNVESYNRIKVSTSLLKQYMANVGASLDPIHLQPKSQSGSGNKVVSASTGSDVPWIIAAAALVLAAAVITLIPLLKYNGLKGDKDDLNSDIESLSSIDKTISECNAAEDKFNDINGFYKSTLNNTEYTPEFIKAISVNMPTNMKFDTIAVKDGVINITGACTSKAQVAQLIIAIKNIENVYGVGLSTISENDGKVTFVCSAGYVTKDTFGAYGEVPTEAGETTTAANQATAATTKNDNKSTEETTTASKEEKGVK